MIPFTDFGNLEVLVIITGFVCLAFYFADPCHLRKCSSNMITQLYSYNGPNGPSSWKNLYTKSNGPQQSPINISQFTNTVSADCENNILAFSEEYNVTPKDMSIYNDGHSVTIYARWESGLRPEITGGPCSERYEFLNARFRWGPNDEEGSEHTMECKAYAMELQAVHIKCGKHYETLSEAVEDDAVLIVSYFYEITSVINPYLQPLIAALPKIRHPCVCVCMEPIPLFFLMPSFISKYVSYVGSLTHPPCTEGVLWIIQTEPLGIASSQVAQFRRLCSFSGNLVMNRRPVQNINDRDIIFYD
ncbi:hypothetical protein RN001_005106 [Aquatica leii]|uniref:Alpha-carbonic anhydrase domain-containing protein n=1 Tax=Aquatica leii TaxID=1421715 RepID=A0AAN7PBI5_9COLE|nr:hypothetical protein RN001_005106 [Aquatica leii]